LRRLADLLTHPLDWNNELHVVPYLVEAIVFEARVHEISIGAQRNRWFAI